MNDPVLAADMCDINRENFGLFFYDLAFTWDLFGMDNLLTYL